MADITITFDDGKQHIYSGAPDDLQPGDVYARVQKDFPNQKVKSIDRKAATTVSDGRAGRISAPADTFKVEEQAPSSFVKDIFQSMSPGLAVPTESKMVTPSQKSAETSGYLKGAVAGVPGALSQFLNIPSDVYNTIASRAPVAFPGAIMSPRQPSFEPLKPGEYAQAPRLPSSEEIGTALFKEPQTEEEKRNRATAAMAAELATGAGALAAGSKVAGLGSRFIDVLRGTEPKKALETLTGRLTSGEIERELIPQRGVTPQDLNAIKNEISGVDVDKVGQSSLDKIKTNVDALQKQRQQLAAQTYGAARYSMDTRTAAGDVFQESKPGKDVIQYFRNKITPVDGQIAVSEAEEKEINGILRDLVGKTERVEPSAILTESGEPAIPASLKTSYSSPDVLRELLRRLRDRSNGAIEGYAGLSTKRAGEFADKLASAIGDWDGELAKADKLYREQSELLHPTRTARGKAATKREKFDLNEYAVDPKTLPPKFFNSRQGVEQFTDLVGGNKALVEQEAEKYALSQLRNKSSKEMRSWFNEAQKAGWLNYDVLPQTTKNVAERIYALEYEDMAKPISSVLTDFNNGVIKADELPAKLRSAVAGEGLPEEPVKRLMKEIDEVEKSTNKTEKARSLVKKLAVGSGLVGIGYEIKNILGGL